MSKRPVINGTVDMLRELARVASSDAIRLSHLRRARQLEAAMAGRG